MKSGWGRLLPSGCLSIFPTMSFILFKFWANKEEKWFPAASCLHGFTYIIYGEKNPIGYKPVSQKNNTDLLGLGNPTQWEILPAK